MTGLALADFTAARVGGDAAGGVGPCGGGDRRRTGGGRQPGLRAAGLGADATVSPYAGLTVADSGTRAWRVGARFRHDASLSLSLEGTRSENVGAADPEHTVELRASLRH